MKKLVYLFLLIGALNLPAQVIKTIEPGEGKILTVSFSHNGKYLAFGTTCAYFSTECIYCYSTSDWKRMWENGNKGMMPSQFTDVTSVKFSNDDSYILTTQKSTHERSISVALWNLRGEPDFIPVNVYYARNAHFTSDDKYIILNRIESNHEYTSNSYNFNGKANIDYVEISTGKVYNQDVKKYTYSEKGNFKNKKDASYKSYLNIASNDLKNIVLLESFDNDILVWNRNENTCNVLHSKNELIEPCIAVSPDGTKAAIGNYSKENWIFLWDLNKKTVLKTFKGHEDKVKDIVFSPDGNYVVSASEDESIKIWDLKSEKLFKTLKKHNGNVNALAFSFDGKYLASGSNDGTIIIWDARELMPDLKLFTANYELQFGLPDKLKIEKENELKALKDYFKPKGEFETTEEYNKRLEKGKEEENAIEEKYKNKLAELKSLAETQVVELEKQKEETDKNKEIEKQSIILNSVKDTVVKISSVGKYNADNQELPVHVKGVTGIIKITPSDAQTLKKDWEKTTAKCKKKLKENLQDFEFYDIIIVHPITKTEYKLE